RSAGRTHAGIDFFVEHGTEVIAMTKGKVKAVYNFYAGTKAVEVKSTDNTIIRYTEIKPSVKVGEILEQSQKVGDVIRNNTKKHSSMLHLEVYMGTSSGQLTQRKNKQYNYVPIKNYQRRSDLIDPTGAKDLRVIK
ncbi:M23 family metallopeptidase, partial [Romboutsia sp.]|uniref:M23 family metallopeptidase n=1 Tax=Romboutsia sp. TaxID=1965302 RepID=UPI002C772972